LIPEALAATGSYSIATGAPNVNFTGSDNLSGLVSAPPAAVPVSEGSNQAVSATVFDLAGNSASFTVGPLNVDVTAPTLGAISVAPGLCVVNSAASASSALTELASGFGTATWNWNANGADINSAGSLSAA
jgi:hypothetical protein